MLNFFAHFSNSTVFVYFKDRLYYSLQFVSGIQTVS